MNHPIDLTPPLGYRALRVEDANALRTGARVELWDGVALWPTTVISATEDALNVRVARSGARVALELWDPDLEDAPRYAPRTRDGALVAVEPLPSAPFTR